MWWQFLDLVEVGVLFLPDLPGQSQSVGEWCFMFQSLPHL